MKNTARGLAVAFAVFAFGFYLWTGLTYEDDFFPDYMGWIGWQMALPIMALTIVPIVFAFTGDGILQALTGLNSGEFRGGQLGLGTVKSFRHTGVTLNDQPQVRIEFRVEAADGKVFDSTARMVVPLTELALLRPGVVLPVRYLPGRYDKVEVDQSGNGAEAQRVMNESMIRKGFTTAAKLDIAERGIRAQAVVQALTVPGEIRDGHSKIDLALVVTRPDGTTFGTRVQKFLPPTAVGHVQVGRIVQVHYLPENEMEVVLSLPVNA
ncbi:hypothetical protein [Nocardia bovistercoris]|uniref:Uncharacterized protein n=1 Tax=Nocardia bovistercoris TaxID=2785916 RepID=A0A931IBN7_9NOCA|nr:hypothetical protein [Nocardia bovistercoris]MBH0778647.1 hypothetical protein [Nocardia bovistercoris]